LRTTILGATSFLSTGGIKGIDVEAEEKEATKPTDLTNPSQQLAKQEVPILADLPFLHLDVV